MNIIVLLIVLLQTWTVLSTRCRTNGGNIGICKPLNECNVMHDMSRQLARCGATGLHCCPTSDAVYSSTVPPTSATTISTTVPTRVATKDASKKTTRVVLKFPTECGWTPMYPMGHILGHHIMEPDEYSWLARLVYGNENKYRDCAGSVINSRYVLTAAHCVTGAAITSAGGLTSVRLGAFDENGHICDYGTKSCAHYQQFGIEEIKVHGQYSASKSIVNDIALSRLDRAIVFGPRLMPICLPFGKNNIPEPPVNSVLTVAGWHLNVDTNDSPGKTYVSTTIWEADKCSIPFFDNKKHICVVESGKSICNGDSGEPLMNQFQPRRFCLEGIVSYGIQNCNQSNTPGVYTRVRSYERWLRRNIKM